MCRIPRRNYVDIYFLQLKKCFYLEKLNHGETDKCITFCAGFTTEVNAKNTLSLIMWPRVVWLKCSDVSEELSPSGNKTEAVIFSKRWLSTTRLHGGTSQTAQQLFFKFTKSVSGALFPLFQHVIRFYGIGHKCNFIHAHNESTAFPTPISTKSQMLNRIMCSALVSNSTQTG